MAGGDHGILIFGMNERSITNTLTVKGYSLCQIVSVTLEMVKIDHTRLHHIVLYI